jgi:hypothetical protein
MSDDDEASFDRRIVVVGILGAYAIYLIFAASGSVKFNELSNFFAEFIDLSDNRKRTWKILLLPLFCAIILSVTGFAEFLSEKSERINFAIGLFISLLASLSSAYIANMILRPQYDETHKDLYKVYIFMMSLTIPYIALIFWHIYRNFKIGGST